MVTGSGLLAMAMTAVGAAGAGDEPISCQVRVLTMDGLGWRSTYYPRLQPVARRGTSAVWTADRALAETMTGQALAATIAPKGTSPGQPKGGPQSKSHPIPGETTVDLKSQVHYVAHMQRVADGPMNQATAIAFQPETAQVEEGFRAGVSGRKLDQGVLATVAIEETHIKAIHTVAMAESYAAGDPPRSVATPSAREILGRFFQAVEEKTFGKAAPRISFTVQVPEVSHAKVEGEWLIPSGGILLVSLGVETVADERGMAAVRERVALLEIEAVPTGPALTSTRFDVAPTSLSPFARLAMPALPARSVPEAVDPDGKVVNLLPMLPEALGSADPDRIEPAPDRPSPQSIHAPSGRFARLPMPATPARSVPEAVDPNGQVVDLPPLPETVATSDRNRIKPGPNQPSPQSLVTTDDSQLAQTGYAEKSLAAVDPLPEVSALLASFCKKLIEAMPDNRFAINVECDGQSCKITVEDRPAREDDQCPAETNPSRPMGGPPASRGDDQACAASADSPAARMARLGTIVEAMAKAMANLALAEAEDGVGEYKGLTLPPAKYIQDDVRYFPPGPDLPRAIAPPASQPGRAGEAETVSLGVSMKASSGSNELVKQADLSAALKNPGRTETVHLPMGGGLSMEIKATVVPTPAEAPGNPSPR